MKPTLLFIILLFLVSIVAAQENFDNAPKLFPIKRDEKIGYIDKTGKIIIEARFDGAYSFSGGLARVNIGGQYWYINQKGQIISDDCSSC